MKGESRISLLIEGYPRTGYQTYSKIVGRSTSGLCISRLHPDYVAQKYGLEMSKRYWLSGQKGDEVIAPKSLHQLIKVVRSEMRGRSGGCMFMDGLEYLLLYNDMGKVMSAMEEIDIILRSADVEMVVSVDPLTFEQKDVERLWRTFPRYTAEEMLLKHSIGQPQNISLTAPTSADRETAGLKV
jgi:hypothetical protein